jgi:hypothetical protein
MPVYPSYDFIDVLPDVFARMRAAQAVADAP